MVQKHNWPNPRVVVLNTTFPWWLFRCQKLRRYQLILFSFIADQRILQHDWIRDTTGITQPKRDGLMCKFTWMTNSMQKNRTSLDSFQIYWCLKNSAIGLAKGTTGYIQPKEVKPDVTVTWWLSSCQKSKKLLDFVPRYWWSKNPAIWLEVRCKVVPGQFWSHPTKCGRLRSYLSLMIISIPKFQVINWFPRDIMTIKESCDLIGQEVQLITPNQKR